MSRRKQVVPKRRFSAAEAAKGVTESCEDTINSGSREQNIERVLRAGTDNKQRNGHQPCHEDIVLPLVDAGDVYAFAELIIATRRLEEGRTGPESGADTAHLLSISPLHSDLFEDPLTCGTAYKQRCAVLLSWGGVDDHDIQHKVLCQLPDRYESWTSKMLQKLRVCCQQVPAAEAASLFSQQIHVPGPHPLDKQCQHSQQQHQQFVQYTTKEVPSDILQQFQSDVIMLPELSAVNAAIQQCEAAAAAAVNAIHGSSAHEPSSTVLLPAQHISLMAAAAFTDLAQEHRQQQPAAPQGSSTAEEGPADVSNSISSSSLVFWRLRIGLSHEQLFQETSWHARYAEQTKHASYSLPGLQSLLHWLVPHWVPDKSIPRGQLLSPGTGTDGSAGFDAADLYGAVKPRGDESVLLTTPPELLPTLRPYQRRAVAWMLSREGVQQQQQELQQGSEESEPCADSTVTANSGWYSQLVQQKLHPIWRCGLLLGPSSSAAVQYAASCSSSYEVNAELGVGVYSPLLSGEDTADAGKSSSSSRAQPQPVIYFCPVTGMVSLEAFPAPEMSGGILADEMGLGKTVELLALISTHRFQREQPAPPAPAAMLDALPAAAAAAAAGGALALNAKLPGSYDSNCCCKCGEALETGYYTTHGWVQGQRASSLGLDLNSPYVGEQDDEEYQPGRRRVGKNSKQAGKGRNQTSADEAGAVGARGRRGQAKQQQQQQQLHGAGHRGAKRQRISGTEWALPQQHQQHEGWLDQDYQGAVFSTAAVDQQPMAGYAVGSSMSSSGVVCSGCLRQAALQEVDKACGTTLIVVPSNILVQWVDELLKHIKPGTLSLKVYVGQYQPGAAAPAAHLPRRSNKKRPAAGSNDVRSTAAAAAGGGASAAATAAAQVVTAAELAAADVVVTTYDVLRREFVLQPGDEGSDRSLRRKKRYAVVPTPLSRLRFWRLVLDEAQQVQGSAAKAAEMTRLVRATHRWAVTGTPISRGVEDLLGTLSCLKAEPWCNGSWWWKNAIAEPLANGGPDGWTTLLRVMCPRLGGVLWRSAKADVLAEMGLPAQAQHTTLLRLSAIERHWYNRGHHDCAAKAKKVLQDALTRGILIRRGVPANNTAAAAAAKAAAAAIAAGGDGRELDAGCAALLGSLMDRQLTPGEQRKLLLPLLRLRQACLHPQVGAAGLSAALTSGGSSSPLTMDQILIVLTTKAKTEAEESQRQLLGALNGLAALMRLNGDCAAAVAAYRHGLATAEANKQEVRTDPLQLLHTLHNLHDLLQHLADKYKAGHIAAAAAAPQDGSSSSSAHAPYGPGVPRTLRDDTLASEAAAIQKNYLTQRMTDLEAAAGPYVKALREALPGHYHRGLGLRTDGQVASKGHPHGPSDAHTKPGLSSSREGSGQRAKATPGSDGSSLWQQAMMGEGVDDDMSWLEDDGAAAASDNDDPGTAAAAAAAGHSSGIESGWYTGVLDALESSGKGDEVAELIREKLQEADTYRQKVAQNATSFANRFDTLHGLKLLISQELSALSSHQYSALQQLEQLHHCCTESGGPQQGFIEQAGQCGRCRAEMGVAGLVCSHCRLDEQMRKWEARLFSLHTRALVAGTQIDAEAAAAQAQTAALRRVGQGGLNEAAGEQGAAAAAAAAAGDGSGRRQDTAVSETQIVRHPSEVERVLRLLQQQVSRQGLAWHLPGVSESAGAHLDRLEASRRLFISAGALSVAQRQLLYAHDELAMALLRIETRLEGQQVSVHQGLFRLTEAEQVTKNSELSLERVLAEADLKRALGKLRYLRTIAAARRRAAAAAAAAEGTAAAAALQAVAAAGCSESTQQRHQQAPPAAGAVEKPPPRAAAAAAALHRASAAAAAASGQQPTAEPSQHQQQVLAVDAPGTIARTGDEGGAIIQDNCPICHDQVEAAAAVLPCGHVLCCGCADGLTARIPAAVPQPQRRIACPTCRSRTHVSDVAYVDSSRSSTYAYVSTESTTPAAGDGLASLGSPRRCSSSGGDIKNSYPWQGEQQLNVSGSYGTKIEALLRRLLFVMQQDCTAKTIVFSSWQDGLDIVSHALGANGVAHAYGKGRKGFLKALEQFKGTEVNESAALGAPAAAVGDEAFLDAEDVDLQPGDGTPAVAASPDSKQQHWQPCRAQPQHPSSNARQAASSHLSPRGSQAAGGPRVLLLLVNQGAAGLNLIEAQHVVLLEPLLDPAQELQALGRVNRFGQTRTTHVHRFVIEHTIEENVAALCRQRAAAMDMSAAVPVRRSSSSSGGGSNSGGDAANLTISDIAALLSTKWREGDIGDEPATDADMTTAG